MLSCFGLLICIIAVFVDNLFWKRAAVLVLIGAAIFAIPAFFSGEGAEHALEKSGVVKDIIKPHERSAKLAFGGVLVTGAVSILAWFTIVAASRHLRKIFAALAAIAALSSALMLYTSFEGGKIVHREIRGEASIPVPKQNSVLKEKDD